MSFEDDQRAHFLIMLGDLCGAAELARLPVEVSTDDGRVFRGIPDLPAAADPADAYDDTGYVGELRIDGETVSLSSVVAFGVGLDAVSALARSDPEPRRAAS